MHAVDLLDDMTGGPHWIAVHNAMRHDRRCRPRRGGADPRAPQDRAGRARRQAVAEVTRVRRGELRDYGIGAQILLDLGVKNMILLTNTRRTIVGLEGYGLNIVEQRPIEEPLGE